MTETGDGIEIVPDAKWNDIVKKPKTYSEYEEELGPKVSDRAEVLAAIDCLMHHLKDDDQFFNFSAVAINDEYNWNLLDWDPLAGASRCESYMELANGMDEAEFNKIVMTFATIVRTECFESSYRPGAFG